MLLNELNYATTHYVLLVQVGVVECLDEGTGRYIVHLSVWH